MAPLTLLVDGRDEEVADAQRGCSVQGGDERVDVCTRDRDDNACGDRGAMGMAKRDGRDSWRNLSEQAECSVRVGGSERSNGGSKRNSQRRQVQTSRFE